MQISYYLPNQILSNDELSAIYENWTVDKIYEKTGIRKRHISAADETVSDMAVEACLKLFSEYDVSPNEIDFLILATQTPDYKLPTTACIVQDRLKLRTNIGAFDINLGCSAFIYALSLGKSLINSSAAKTVLLVMSEQYSKHIHPDDKSVRTIFGDGASAILLSQQTSENVGNFVFGTDGSGYNSLIIPAGGGRLKASDSTRQEYSDSSGNTRCDENIFMDGAEIFNFTIKRVPIAVKDVLVKNNLEMDDIDLFVFHQANKFMLKHLQKLLKIPDEKFLIDIEDIGNTVSASIPIALKRAEISGMLKKGDKVMLVGFGVGLSYGACVLHKWGGGK